MPPVLQKNGGREACEVLRLSAGTSRPPPKDYFQFPGVLFREKDTFLAIHYGRIEDHGLPGEETAGVTHFCRSRPGLGGGKKRQHGLERGSRHFH